MGAADRARRRRRDALVPLVTSLRAGAREYCSVLFVRGDSNVFTLRDLRGTTVAWVDRARPRLPPAADASRGRGAAPREAVRRGALPRLARRGGARGLRRQRRRRRHVRRAARLARSRRAQRLPRGRSDAAGARHLPQRAGAVGRGGVRRGAARRRARAGDGGAAAPRHVRHRPPRHAPPLRRRRLRHVRAARARRSCARSSRARAPAAGSPGPSPEARVPSVSARFRRRSGRGRAAAR